MWKVEPPAYTAQYSYTTCISRVRNRELKQRFKSVEEEVVAAAASYEVSARQASLHLLDSTNFKLSAVSKDEMISVYESRMVKKDSAGRHIYDELLLAAPYGRCPLCGQRAVSTLDHHVPKTSFPALTVDPLNLVPVCSDCNKLKSDKSPALEADQTLHPYFDDVEGDVWLHARVVEVMPTALHFYVEKPSTWSNVLLQRARTHFKTFNLATLYAAQAAQELGDIRFHLAQLHARGGPTSVRQHLREQADSRRAAHVNSWQTATYRALSESAWFCQGGFEK